MKVTVLTLLFALFLVIASLINYSFFVTKNNSGLKQFSNGESTKGYVPTTVFAGHKQGTAQPWVWLLPILALPILFFPFTANGPEDEESDDDFNYWPSEVTYLSSYKPYAVGLKGGKVTKKKTRFGQKKHNR
jgi:hypothetical protein